MRIAFRLRSGTEAARTAVRIYDDLRTVDAVGCAEEEGGGRVRRAGVQLLEALGDDIVRKGLADEMEARDMRQTLYAFSRAKVAHRPLAAAVVAAVVKKGPAVPTPDFVSVLQSLRQARCRPPDAQTAALLRSLRSRAKLLTTDQAAEALHSLAVLRASAALGAKPAFAAVAAQVAQLDALAGHQTPLHSHTLLLEAHTLAGIPHPPILATLLPRICSPQLLGSAPAREVSRLTWAVGSLAAAAEPCRTAFEACGERTAFSARAAFEDAVARAAGEVDGGWGAARLMWGAEALELFAGQPERQKGFLAAAAGQLDGKHLPLRAAALAGWALAHSGLEEASGWAEVVARVVARQDPQEVTAALAHSLLWAFGVLKLKGPAFDVLHKALEQGDWAALSRLSIPAVVECVCAFAQVGYPAKGLQVRAARLLYSAKEKPHVYARFAWAVASEGGEALKLFPVVVRGLANAPLAALSVDDLSKLVWAAAHGGPPAADLARDAAAALERKGSGG